MPATKQASSSGTTSCSPAPSTPTTRTGSRKRSAARPNTETRRLRNHLLALWCGSNEDSWGFVDWWNGGKNPKAPFWGGARSYNYILPEIVRRNCPEIPYWNGSPYGGGHPDGNDAGDRHHWMETMMSPNMEDRISPEAYDKVEARFITEYGYVGPSIPESVARYHAGQPVNKRADLPSSLQHLRERDGHRGDQETSPGPEGMSNNEYFLYAALVQGLMYGYSLESLRASPRNSGSLFWMYSDCWGEVGWTIIDFYQKRKPSWYFVAPGVHAPPSDPQGTRRIHEGHRHQRQSRRFHLQGGVRRDPSRRNRGGGQGDRRGARLIRARWSCASRRQRETRGRASTSSAPWMRER